MWSLSFFTEHYHLIVRMLYNVIFVQALVSTSCKFTVEEREAWRKKGRPVSFIIVKGTTQLQARDCFTLFRVLVMFITDFLFVWWCLMPLSTIFQLYRGGQFYWWPGDPEENHWPVLSHWQTLSHNVVHLALIKIRIHNISGDMHWLHR